MEIRCDLPEIFLRIVQMVYKDVRLSGTAAKGVTGLGGGTRRHLGGITARAGKAHACSKSGYKWDMKMVSRAQKKQKSCKMISKLQLNITKVNSPISCDMMYHDQTVYSN